MDMRCPVRVICGPKRVNAKTSDIIYMYNGLYIVTKCWEEIAQLENMRSLLWTMCWVLKASGLKLHKWMLGFRAMLCASRNGGKIPFNIRGSIIRTQPLGYECGPSCKCPLLAKIELANMVFMTESRGWDLSPRDHVSSRSFICEYVGDLLDENEAERRIYNDENPTHNNNLKVVSDSSRRKDEDGLTVDVVKYGNVGRFINHSCLPNLYAQKIMYYHGDRRVPHITQKI
uniref:SET domain-containing protein n=1 Tax=Solanum lycopersicum TaxID=4081 RepID=A0A3Q7HKS3_SOLLC